METIVVTGAAGALGGAVARKLARSGARLALVGHASDALTKIAAEASRDGAGAVAIDVDVADARAWRDGLARIEREVGAVHGAVLAAGGWKGGKPLHDGSDEPDATYRAMLAANLDTVHASLRALLPGMVERGRGSIVVVGSRASEQPWSQANAAAYAASKSAAIALVQASAAEVLARGVRVNAVLPSTIDTPANRRAMPKADPSSWVAPESIADVIAFLLSEAARDVSGAALPVYGRA